MTLSQAIAATLKNSLAHLNWEILRILAMRLSNQPPKQKMISTVSLN